MLASKSLENLPVWRDSINFVKEIYLLTDLFPETEKHGLVQHIRNCAISLPVDISKSINGVSTVDYREHLVRALNSVNEIITFLTIAQELGFIGKKDLDLFRGKSENIRMQAAGLLNKLERDADRHKEEEE